jgi:CRISPR-associated protein Cas1
MLSLPDFRHKSVVVCYASEGQKVGFKNDNLIVHDSEGNVVLQTTCYRIFSLWIIGKASITSGILERSKRFGFSIYLLSYSHRLYGVWNAPVEGNFLLRRRQYTYDGLEIARHLVRNKIENQARLIRAYRGKSRDPAEVAARLESYAAHVLEAQDLNDLLGREGAASRLFFEHWYEELGWQGRKPRTKVDATNALLDIGYTYLFNFVECLLNLYGFDLYQGVYHRCFYQRKSLACDLVEPFRCIIDRQIRKAYNLRQFRFEDFEVRQGRYFLPIARSKEYTRWLLEAILEHKEALFTYVQNYYRCFMRGKPIEAYPVFRLDG